MGEIPPLRLSLRASSLEEMVTRVVVLYRFPCFMVYIRARLAVGQLIPAKAIKPGTFNLGEKMNDNILQWKKPEKKIWQCYCGCQQWFLHNNGDVECCGCNEISQNMKCLAKEEDDNT
jgi:hypothetical protein